MYMIDQRMDANESRNLSHPMIRVWVLSLLCNHVCKSPVKSSSFLAHSTISGEDKWGEHSTLNLMYPLSILPLFSHLGLTISYAVETGEFIQILHTMALIIGT